MRLNAFSHPMVELNTKNLTIIIGIPVILLVGAVKTVKITARVPLIKTSWTDT